MGTETRDVPRRGDPSRLEAPSAVERDLARVFFLPGVGGGASDFETLDAHTCAQLGMRPLTYPGMGARGAVLSSMEATAEVVAADIVSLRPEGPLALVGYSFGGSLALEVSRQLARAGRRVAFLGILDAPFGIEELQGLFEVLRLATVPRRAAKALVEATARSEVTLRLMAAAAAPTPVDQGRGEAVRRALLTHLRTKALAGWKPQGCAAAGVLICTGILGEGNRDRWRALCPNLDHVRIEARHESLLGDETVGDVAAALVAAARAQGLVPVSEPV